MKAKRYSTCPECGAKATGHMLCYTAQWACGSTLTHETAWDSKRVYRRIVFEQSEACHSKANGNTDESCSNSQKPAIRRSCSNSQKPAIRRRMGKMKKDLPTDFLPGIVPVAPEKAKTDRNEQSTFVRRQCSDAANRHGCHDLSRSFSALAADQLFSELAMNEAKQSTRGFNAIFIHSSLDDANLTCSEFRIYGHLSRRAGDGVAWPGIDSMAKICRMHRETVIQAVKVLEGRGMISIERKEGMRNLYTLTDFDTWAHQSEMVNGPVDQSEMVNATSRKSGTPPVGNGERKVLHLKPSTEGYPIPPTLNSPKFLEAWENWISDRRERRKPVGPRAITLQLRRLEAMGVDKAIASIEFSIESGYQGLFEPKSQNGHDTKIAPGLGGADKIILSDELKRIGTRIKQLNDDYGSHQDWSDKDRQTLRELSARRKEIKTTLGIKY